MIKITLLSTFALLASQVLFAQLDFSAPKTLKSEHLKRMDSAINSGQYERVTSVLIARDGKLVFEKYYQDNNVDSKHNTRSATKTMATLLTGIAIRDGHVKSVEDKIFSYLGHKLPVENPDSRKDEITLKDLLTMSSVLECNDNNPWSRGNEERMYPIEDWTSFFLGLPIRSYPWEPKPEDQPYGRSFSYCTAGAATMAEVLERAVGKPIHEYAQEQLFKPLDITDYKFHFNPEGILNTAGGSEYRSRDLLKLIQLCLQEGEWNGKRILPKSFLEQATTAKATVRENQDYGYLIWLKNYGEDQSYPSYYMAGNGGQRVLAIPSLNTCVVITTTNYGNRNAHDYSDKMINEYILAALEE